MKKHFVGQFVMISALVFMLPLFSQGVLLPGQEIPVKPGIHKGKVRPLEDGNALKGLHVQQSGRWEVPVKGADRLRLVLAKRTPGFMERAIHRHVQHRQQFRYLAYLIANMKDPMLVQSNLANELQTAGTPLNEAYLQYVNTNPKHVRDFLRKQSDFVVAMLRYISNMNMAAPEAQRQNAQFYAALIGQMKAVKAVSIAERDHFPAGAADPGPTVLQVPVQLLKEGYRGSLGAVTDMLQKAAYSVYPNVLNVFMRQHLRLLFSGAV